MDILKQVRFLDPKTAQTVKPEIVSEDDFSVAASVLRARKLSQMEHLSLSEQDLSIEQQENREQHILKVIEQDFLRPIKIRKTSRAFIRCGELKRITLMGTSQSKCVVHLFSDMLMYSSRSELGLRLKKMFELSNCSVEMVSKRKSSIGGMEESSPRRAQRRISTSKAYSFTISCSSPSKTLTFSADSMKTFLVWVRDLKLFIKRSKDGLKGKPEGWNPQSEEQKVMNPKASQIIKRRLEKSKLLRQLVIHEMDAHSGDELEDSDVSIISEESDDESLDESKFQDSAKPLVELRRRSDKYGLATKRIDTRPRSLSSSQQRELQCTVNGVFVRSQPYDQPYHSCFRKGRSREVDVLSFDSLEEIRRKREKLYKERKRCIEVLSHPQQMGKFSPSGSKTMRWFKVSDNGEVLLWGRKKDRMTGFVDLGDITRLTFGPHSSRFQFYRWEKGYGKPWNCFSIHVHQPNRTIDIEANGSRQLRDWFLGIQMLIPPWTAFTVTRGELLWYQMHMKMDQEAMELGISRAKAYALVGEKGDAYYTQDGVGHGSIDE